jgi:protein-disulfide isomerase
VTIGRSYGQDYSGTGCKPLTEGEKLQATTFIRRQFGFTRDTTLYVASSRRIPNTCYVRFTLKTKTEQSVAQDFYLSPDHRFLSLTLFDLQMFSSEAERTTEARLRAEAANASVPVAGDRAAPLIVSVFSDFQCPFCAEAENMLKNEITLNYPKHVALAYFNFPLQNHSWAGKAAELMACVHDQEPSVFWQVAEWIYGNQSVINEANAEAMISAKASELSRRGSGQLAKCVAKREGAPAIDHDKTLAEDLSVTSTPTIFVGGRRLDGAVSAATIKRYIDEQLTNSKDR